MPLGKKRQLRQRKVSSSESEDCDQENDQTGKLLEETKELQKLRQRAHGTSVATLASGVKKPKVEEAEVDVLKLKTGGMTHLKTLKASELSKIEGVAHFAAETNRRDEDADMLKYVEVELAKRKGVEREESREEKVARPEDALFVVPAHLMVGQSNQSEDMLSNQMLSGIPEVDLGIDAKIKNIERTEEAKQEILEERRKKRETVSFVPTNMAVNYVQHNRWNQPGESKNTLVPHMPKGKAAEKKAEAEEKKPKAQPGTEKASDDYHFDKFKNRTRTFRR